jgi:hypothetical protein
MEKDIILEHQTTMEILTNDAPASHCPQSTIQELTAPHIQRSR